MPPKRQIFSTQCHTLKEISAPVRISYRVASMVVCVVRHCSVVENYRHVGGGQ